jgi:ubiquitin-activating enzyme E1 C
MKRVPGCIVTPYFGKIQDKDQDFYSQFSIVICGLDSVEARRWINAMVIGMYDEQDPSTLIPIIDGGTEGFKGQARLIVPKMTACYECSLDMQTKPKTFPMCTIANTPRLPEHCIQWASQLEWPKIFPDTKLDGDDPNHIQWVTKVAQDRGALYDIHGITYSMTQGVVKNIIPAIASTNAIIAASCSNEAFKLATNCVPNINNYMMYVGDRGVYTYTFALEKKENCPVCGLSIHTIPISENATLQDLVDILAAGELYFIN